MRRVCRSCAREQSQIDDPEMGSNGTVAQVATHLAAGRSMVLTTLGLAPCAGRGARRRGAPGSDRHGV